MEPSRLAAPAITVVVPALNEEARVGATLRRVAAGTGPTDRVEVIVVDGGSDDATPGVAAGAGARVLTAPRGRASQMNAGAAAARGEVLLFLHADTHLPAGWPDAVRETLARPGVVAGAFRFRLAAPGLAFRVIEAGVSARCLALGLPYGDQALFLPRARFDAIGGYREAEEAEDLDLVLRLSRIGRVALARAEATTSERAWRRRGLVRTSARNGWLLVSYAFRRGAREAVPRRPGRRLRSAAGGSDPAKGCTRYENLA